MSREKFNYSEFFDRIYTVANHYNIKKAQIYNIMGISAAYVSMLKADKVGGSFNMILNFAKNFTKINIAWLLFGEGAMFLPEQGCNKVGEAEPFYGNAPLNELQTLFNRLQNLPPHEQEAAILFIKGALKLLNK